MTYHAARRVVRAARVTCRLCDIYLSIDYCRVMGFDRATLPSLWAIAAVVPLPCLRPP